MGWCKSQISRPLSPSFSLYCFSSHLMASSSRAGGSGDGERPRRRRGRERGIERPRQRSSNGVWPEPFVEALAYQVAIEAARTNGRLAAGPALVNVFQVCSTWRAVSHSEMLWQNLTRQIWGRDRLLHDTWRDEYAYRHQTAYNFRMGRAVYTPLDIGGSDQDDDSVSCRCLALSDFHLACGFLDGSVRLFDLSSRLHVTTFQPQDHGGLGHFSRMVTGIILSDANLVFASLGGDIHVAVIHDGDLRRAHIGNVMHDGALVDFNGCSRWWVGLFAGVPGHAFRIWDAHTEELVFIGETLTDPQAVMGWHMLAQLTESFGRVRVSSQESAVACTSERIIVLDLPNNGLSLGQEQFEEGLMVDSVDVSRDKFLVVDSHGVASIRLVESLEEVCRFEVRVGSRRRVMGRVIGCINGGYAFLCTGGVVRAWDIEQGERLYRLIERIGEANALICDERYVASCSGNSNIHLWDFGAP